MSAPDIHDQADRAGAPTAAPQPEREWTDLQALARAVAQTKSREEALAVIAAEHAAMPEARKGRRRYLNGRAWWAVRDEAERERAESVDLTVILPGIEAANVVVENANSEAPGVVTTERLHHLEDSR